MSAKLSNTDLAAELSRRVSRQTIIRQDEPLSKRTTLRVGGPADVLVEPASESDLAAILRFCRERGINLFVLGRGSNLLVRDGGFRGVVACLCQPVFSRIEVSENRLNCGAGTRLKTVAVEARRHELTGLEFLEGIPGSVGGALRMNAGAMGSWTFDVVESVRLMDYEGNVTEHEGKALPVEYRACPALKDRIALSALFVGQPGTRGAIERRMNEFTQKRWKSQPAAPSAGCMFKNPEAIPAGRLIDELGLKGTQVGGARVSLEHGNFLVNDGMATARDVLELMEQVRRRALAERGIELEPEVQIVGED